MTNNWPPPEPMPAAVWPPPQGAPMPTAWPPPQTAQSAQPPYGWPQQYPVPANDPAIAWVLPINRSGLSIAAGYVGLFGVVLVFLGPVALLLGLLALRDLRRHPGRLGRGRAWFAIISGIWGTAVVLFVAANYLILVS
jgi:hypothetical protein